MLKEVCGFTDSRGNFHVDSTAALNAEVAIFIEKSAEKADKHPGIIYDFGYTLYGSTVAKWVATHTKEINEFIEETKKVLEVGEKKAGN